MGAPKSKGFSDKFKGLKPTPNLGITISLLQFMFVYVEHNKNLDPDFLKFAKTFLDCSFVSGSANLDR